LVTWRQFFGACHACDSATEPGPADGPATHGH
jgi:hypothetical protein